MKHNYNATRQEMLDQLSIMAAEKGCDREMEWQASDGCEDCPGYNTCTVQAWQQAETARAMIARATTGRETTKEV